MLAERLLIARDPCRPSKRASTRAAPSCRHTVLAWGAVSVILSHACAPGVMSTGAVRRVVAAEAAITISNETSRAMRIYLVAGSVDLPLGTVPALATRTFQVPDGFGKSASELQIEARQRGTDVGVRTGGFSVGPDRVVAVALRRTNTAMVIVTPRR
jgi:hypothetical protein